MLWNLEEASELRIARNDNGTLHVEYSSADGEHWETDLEVLCIGPFATSDLLRGDH